MRFSDFGFHRTKLLRTGFSNGIAPQDLIFLAGTIQKDQPANPSSSPDPTGRIREDVCRIMQQMQLG
jgi:hypothetical protein